jgi:sugar lactone lactonase YvrE
MPKTEELTARKVATGLLFGEGIRWRGDTIVVSDMIGRKVVRVDPSSGAIATLLDVPEQPNGLVVCDDGTILVLSMFDRQVLRLDNEGGTRLHADLSSLATGYLGDVVQDAQGNCFVDDVGTRVLHGELPAPVGKVILVRPDGSAETLLSDLAFPNGIVLSADGRTLYLSQSQATPAGIFAYDVEEGPRLTNERRLVTTDGPIDGMSIDDEDGIWACMLASDLGVCRFDQQGNLTHRIDLPGHEPIACSIGGSDGRTMCITAMESLEGKNIFEEMREKRVRSSIFLADVPFAKRLSRP